MTSGVHREFREIREQLLSPIYPISLRDPLFPDLPTVHKDKYGHPEDIGLRNDGLAEACRCHTGVRGPALRGAKRTLSRAALA
jgi:hypothetical protein